MLLPILVSCLLVYASPIPSFKLWLSVLFHSDSRLDLDLYVFCVDTLIEFYRTTVHPNNYVSEPKVKILAQGNMYTDCIFILLTIVKQIKLAMVRNRYNRIPHPALNTKRERVPYNLDGTKIKITPVKSQEDQFFPNRWPQGCPK